MRVLGWFKRKKAEVVPPKGFRPMTTIYPPNADFTCKAHKPMLFWSRWHGYMGEGILVRMDPDLNVSGLYWKEPEATNAR